MTGRMRTIAVINQKGGSGKTTSAINLAAVFAHRGQRTLLVDVDPQSHCALGLAVPESQIELTVAEAMLAADDRPLDTKRLLWNVNKTLDLMPSTTRLAGLEAARGGLADREDRDLRLAAVLRRFEATYEWVVIDCPPSIGLLTFNALRASTEILIPVETGYFALRGAAKQVQTIRALCRRFGQAPPYRVLPTMHDENSPVSCDVLAELQRKFADCVIPVTIRFDQRLKEAASMGSSVTDYAPRSSGSADYAALASYLAENHPVPLRLDPEAAADGTTEMPDANTRRTRGLVAIDLFNHDEAARDGAPGPHAAAAAGHDSRNGGAAFFRPTLDLTAPHSAAPAPAHAAQLATAPAPPVSRAAELAARARRILQRSEELTHRLAHDLPPHHQDGLRSEAPTHSPDPAHASPAHASPAPVGVYIEPAPLPAAVSTPALPVTFGPRLTPQGVLFVYPLALGPRVSIAGDHNAWSGDATVLRFNPHTALHECCLRVTPGKFRYRLVVAGRWFADPFNPISEPNPFGDMDSVLEVPDPEALSEAAAPRAAPAPVPVALSEAINTNPAHPTTLPSPAHAHA
ncbi:MAG: AAA family ATPase [Phycisphaerales bacterium]